MKQETYCHKVVSIVSIVVKKITCHKVVSIVVKKTTCQKVVSIVVKKVRIMKLKFKIQQYQTDAVDSTVDIFNGQPNQGLLEYKLDQGKVYVINNGRRIE
mgnify:CR=1 FL=1